MKRKIITCIFTLNILLACSGCATTTVPVIGDLTPTPAPDPVVTSVPKEEPTVTPLPIIIENAGSVSGPVPVILTPTADEDDYLKTIGIKSDEESVLKIRLSNRTGKKIRQICIFPSFYGADYDEGELMFGDDTFRNKEERVLYYNTAYDEDEENWYMKLVFKNGASYLLSDLPLKDIKEASLYRDGEICYLVYYPVSGGKRISTEEHEREVLLEAQNKEESYDDYEEYDEYDESEYDENDKYDESEYDEDYDRYDYDDEEYE